MPARDKRQKASDVFRDATYVFSRKVPFEEAFPQIDDLRVQVRESSIGRTEPIRTSTYTTVNPPGEFVDCSNPLCYNGGVSVGSVIHAAVRDRKTECTETHGCQGYEGSPKGQRRYRSCLHTFEVTVNIRYKE
jgi:hypothetical protein